MTETEAVLRGGLRLLVRPWRWYGAVQERRRWFDCWTCVFVRQEGWACCYEHLPF